MFLPSNITLQFGDTGDFVMELQRRLALVNAMGEDGATGFFDGPTVNAVMHFQANHGLRSDGVAGPETLRRLNGVIAGDTSSTSDDKKEEEAKAAEAQRLLNELMQAPQEPVFTPIAAVEPENQQLYGETAYAQPAAAPVTAEFSAPELAQQQRDLQQREQMQRDVQMVQQQPNSNDLLAQMLLQTAPPAQAPTPEQNRHERPPLQAQTEVPLLNPRELPPQQPPLHEPATQQPAREAVAAAEPEARGIVGRARQFANAMIQKLNDYFEAKLPPSVLSEVQAIGQSMARSGMKEAPIPSGPELPSRGPDLPTRGPEQQQRG